MYLLTYLLQSRKFWWYLLLIVFFDAASQRHNDVILTSFSVYRFTVPVIFSLRKTRAHRTRATVKLLRREMPGFNASNVWPPNSPDLSPVYYKVWSQCSLSPYLLHSVWLVWLLHLSLDIMPATLANTFMFILRNSALADLGSGGRYN